MLFDNLDVKTQFIIRKKRQRNARYYMRNLWLFRRLGEGGGGHISRYMDIL